MTLTHAFVRGAALLVTALAMVSLSGCRRGEGGRAGDATVEVDTTNRDALDGMSADELRDRAQAISPAEAQQRGLLDTTVHVEQLGSPDSVTPPAGTRP